MSYGQSCSACVHPSDPNCERCGGSEMAGDERDWMATEIKWLNDGITRAAKSLDVARRERDQSWEDAHDLAAEVDRLKNELRDYRTDAPDITKWGYLVQLKHAAEATIARVEAVQVEMAAAGATDGETNHWAGKVKAALKGSVA